MADVLAVEYPRLRCARMACLRLADVVWAGVVAVRALALVMPGRRDRWAVDHGFPSMSDPASWWSGYAAMTGGLAVVPDVMLEPPPIPRVTRQFDPAAAIRFCEGLDRPRVAVMVQLAEPTPLLVAEALRPDRGGPARVLRSTLTTEDEILVTMVLAQPETGRGVHPEARRQARHRP